MSERKSNEAVICAVCGGAGRFATHREDWSDPVIMCPVCRGTGERVIEAARKLGGE